MAPIYNLLEWPFEATFLQDWRAELWAAVEGPEVLEIGVGTGRNVPHYPNHTHVTAIDLSPGMLARARAVAVEQGGANATFREADVQALPYPDEVFNEVVATFAFCSVPDATKGLQEALRVTRPGGRLHLLVHVRSSLPGLAQLMDGVDFPVHWLTGVHVARRTVETLRRTEWQVESCEAHTSAGIFHRLQARAPTL
jgi:ubiquinone/menaquinone biosynthesis C-methylase UbiE